jgi:hypothetical protein
VVRNQGRVTRFVVMAVLQAARAEALGLPKDPAYSWGLNRAIFYAAAKRGFGGNTPASGEAEPPTKRPAREVYRLGEEEAFRDPTAKQLLFTIGDQDQTPQEFEKSVISRFGTKENFRAAWEEARKVVDGFPRATLESQRGFYEDVYKPRRDELSDDWTRKYSPPPIKK